MTISSFETRVLGELSALLSLEIFDYGVEGNRVVCFGRIDLVRGREVSGAAVGMFITEAPRNSVNVEVDVYQGELMLPEDAIDFQEVNIPTLSSSNSSFEFSLTCTYQEEEEESKLFNEEFNFLTF